MMPILLTVWHLKYSIRVQMLKKQRIPVFQHTFVGLYFNLEATNVAYEISAAK
jgi:hypothetical protein